jgi:hypothetical protein
MFCINYRPFCGTICSSCLLQPHGIPRFCGDFDVQGTSENVLDVTACSRIGGLVYVAYTINEPCVVQQSLVLEEPLICIQVGVYHLCDSTCCNEVRQTAFCD